MTTDPDTARKALSQLISTVESDTRYYPKAKTQILSDLEIVSGVINTDPLTITETTVQASQRLRVNLLRYRPCVSVSDDRTAGLYVYVWPIVEGNDPVDYKTVLSNMTHTKD